MTFIESLLLIIIIVGVCIVFSSIFYTLGREDERKRLNELKTINKNKEWRV